MTDFSGLKEQVQQMGDALMADPNTPPPVLAYLHMVAALRLLEQPLDSVHRIQRPPFAPFRTASSPDFVQVKRHSRGTGKIRRAIDPNRVAILEAAADVIDLMGGPMKTSDVYDALGPIREKIGGTEPKSNLSAMMHHSPLFVSHGRGGWSLSGMDAESTEAEIEAASQLRLEDIEDVV